MVMEKLFFQVARSAFLVVAIIAFVGTVVFAVLYCTGVVQATQRRPVALPRPEVAATDVVAKLHPFARASKPGEPTPPAEQAAFGRAKSPLAEMKERYPSARVDELMDLLGKLPDDCRVVTDWIEEAIQAAQGGQGGTDLKDEAVAYVDNAIEVLRSVDPRDRHVALEAFHKERMRVLDGWAAEVRSKVASEEARMARARVAAGKAKTMALGALLAFLLTCQLLAVLAIERNTRYRTAEPAN